VTHRSFWSVLRWSGLPLLVRHALQRGRVTILYYHDIDPADLSRQLSILGERYHFIRLRDYVDARLSGDMHALPEQALVVTFDDGLKGNYDLLEVFRRHGVVPTIFLTSGIVGTNRRFWTMMPSDRSEVERLKRVPDPERLAALASMGHAETDTFPERSALSRAEVDEMKGSVEFQSHTVLHPILPMCSDERAWTEIADSKSDLERDYGLDIYALAYPNGAFSERVIGLSKRAGYRCAVTTVPGLNDAHPDLFRLRRLSIPDDASRDEVIAKASGLSDYLKRIVGAGDRSQ
jgi:poly-beta-1,6-N-acetyl-D-glucosamine N-deacetylase